MNTVVKMRNIGPKSAAWLRQVGVRSEADIKRLGALEVFMKVRKAGFRPSLNLLYALEGAVQDCHWTALAAECKSELVLAVNALEEGKGPKSWGWWRPGKGSAEVSTQTMDPVEPAAAAGESDIESMDGRGRAASGTAAESDDAGVGELGEIGFADGDDPPHDD